MLTHIILMRFRESTTAHHIREFCQRMRALQAEIPELRSLAIGLDELGDSRSWDLAMTMQFDDLPALQRYREHPAHRAVMAFNDPRVADIAAVDYHTEA